MSGQAVAFIHGSFEKKRSEVRPRDLLFAADLVVKTALAMARTGARDYPEQMKNGELADMLTRYLVA